MTSPEFQARLNEIGVQINVAENEGDWSRLHSLMVAYFELLEHAGNCGKNMCFPRV